MFRSYCAWPESAPLLCMHPCIRGHIYVRAAACNRAGPSPSLRRVYRAGELSVGSAWICVGDCERFPMHAGNGACGKTGTGSSYIDRTDQCVVQEPQIISPVAAAFGFLRQSISGYRKTQCRLACVVACPLPRPLSTPSTLAVRDQPCPLRVLRQGVNHTGLVGLGVVSQLAHELFVLLDPLIPRRQGSLLQFRVVLLKGRSAAIAPTWQCMRVRTLNNSSSEGVT